MERRGTTPLLYAQVRVLCRISCLAGGTRQPDPPFGQLTGWSGELVNHRPSGSLILAAPVYGLCDEPRVD